MRISDQKISEFQELYKNNFGEDISTDKAREMGTKLITLLEVVYKPCTQSEDNYLNNSKQHEEQASVHKKN